MRVALGLLLAALSLTAQTTNTVTQRYLYVAVPGADDADPDRSVRILVFDIASAHRLVRRIPLLAPRGDEAEGVRGTAASAHTNRLYVSTTRRLIAIDLITDTMIWEKSYEGHCCDRIAVSPDGRTIYAPAFGRAKWFVIHAATGELRSAIDVMGWPRETRFSRDGARTYLAAWESQVLSIADAATHQIVKTVGPFSASLCPFTVNAKGTLAFANVDGLIGFEIADLQTGLLLDRVAVEGYDKDTAANYECPSHGIAFTPDERELWVADGVRNRLQVFDASTFPPMALTSIELTGQPRWIAFGLDGRFAYSSTGDIVNVATKKIVGTLEDPAGRKLTSENFVEIDFVDGRPVR
jgi:DNA-binding beta-propeller fold protein YncE